MDATLLDDIKKTINVIDDIEALRGKKIFITGANGLIGSFIVDLLMFLNSEYNYETVVIANSRSMDKLEKRFGKYIANPCFKYYLGNINDGIVYSGDIDYIINCASNTHPKSYVSDPVGTIMTNIEGTANVLDLATRCNTKKTIFLSSVEIYGENIYGIDRFKEDEMGYIDCNSLRAGYNESKRCGESLCQAYIEKNGIDISILRLPRVYGPTMKMDDTKALSQFINKAISNEDIVLKSSGEQYFSYLYVADAVSGIINCLLNGEKGAAYNLGNLESDIRLKDLAKLVADIVGVKVVFDLPDVEENKGFSKATIARLDYSKAEKELKFKPQYSIDIGLRNTIEILKQDRHKEEK